MVVTVPDSAATAPLFEQVAVTVAVPSKPITTEAGMLQTRPFLSLTEPFEMVVPAAPVSSKSTVELVAVLLLIPFIFTFLLSPAP